MSEWKSFSIVECDVDGIEYALRHVAEKSSFIQQTEYERDELALWVKEHGQGWLVMLREMASGVTMIKTVPSGILTEYSPVVRSKPLLAVICSVLCCRGASSLVEDSMHLIVECDPYGSCRTTGVSLQEASFVESIREHLESDCPPSLLKKNRQGVRGTLLPIVRFDSVHIGRVDVERFIDHLWGEKILEWIDDRSISNTLQSDCDDVVMWFLGRGGEGRGQAQ